MPRVALTAPIVAIAAFCLWSTAIRAQTLQRPDRRVEQVVRSSTLPRVAVRVDPALPYLGRVEFDVSGRARAEQFLFAETTDGTLGRTLVVHFEHFLPSNDFTFEYPTLRMITIGKHDYLHQTWAMDGLGLLGRPAVSELLTTRGIRAEPDWFLNRYARVVDAAGKHELLIFYRWSPRVRLRSRSRCSPQQRIPPAFPRMAAHGPTWPAVLPTARSARSASATKTDVVAGPANPLSAR